MQRTRSIPGANLVLPRLGMSALAAIGLGAMGSKPRPFSPAPLWREEAPLPPFQRSLRSLPPLLGLRPATKRAIPLGTPAALLPQISKLVSVEKPCPPAFTRNADIIWASPDWPGEGGGVNGLSLES